MRHEKGLEKTLDETLEKLQKQELTPEQVSEAARRTWARLSGEQVAPQEIQASAERIRSCSDLKTLIPDYLNGDLTDARKLLLEDHLKECLSCRRAFRDARGDKAKQPARRRASLAPKWKWSLAAAAAVVLSIGLAQLGVLQQFLPAPSGPRAVLTSLDGQVFSVTENGTVPLEAGAEILEGQAIRVAKNSDAMLTMRDGSRVEVNQRAQLAISESYGGKQIQLARGSIIVEAAKQRDGYFYVGAGDCLVSVKGTVFSVNRGTKGSRVAVIEGTVSVTQGGEASTLSAGEQVSTHRSLMAIPVEQEIAWSRNANEHISLLREFTSLRREIEATLTPTLHSSPVLLDMAPDDTVIYLSVPNMAANLGDAYAVFQERLAQSPVLQQWWSDKGAEFEPQLEQVLARLQDFGSSLGDEVVVGVGLSDAGEPSDPYFLAEVLNPADFDSLLQGEVDTINAEIGAEGAALVVVTDPSQAVAVEGEALYLMTYEGVFAGSPTLDRLLQIANVWDSGANGFAGTTFHSKIADAYARGVGFLLAVDLRTVVGAELAKEETQDQEAFSQLGIMDAEYLIAERRNTGDQTEMSAAVSFSDARRGMASWLADPAPMGGIEFVSAKAAGVAAFVVKDPVLMVEDLISLVSSSDPEALAELAAFEAETGKSITDDFAAPLGGEVIIAIDGPLLPEPSWKLIVEVYDSARLQQTLEWGIEKANQHLETVADAGRLELLVTQMDGRTFYTLVSPDMSKQVHYVYVDSYLLAAPNKSLLLDAIDFRSTGFTLTTAPEFVALLPEDGRSDFSGLLYQNVGSVLQPLIDQLPTTGTSLSEETQAQIAEFVGNLQPTLAYAYGESDRITVASTGDDFSVFNLAAAAGMLKQLGGDTQAVPSDGTP
jgi:ferric-dicitrate binding protein FerR (iron transport regulator)